MLNIGFRLDANQQIGNGHFCRCVNFTSHLPRNKFKVFFITCKINESLKKILESNRIDLINLSLASCQRNKKNLELQSLKKIIIEKKISSLFLDKLIIDSNYEEKLSSMVNNLIIIDDVLDKKRHCSIIIDFNNLKKINTENNIRSSLVQFFIDKRFFQRRTKNLEKIKTIMISFGSTDKHNVTEKLVKLLKSKLFGDFNFLVIVGMHNKRKTFIEKECKSMKNFKYIFSPNNIEKYMINSDICIGSLGISIYERFFIGLPSIIINTSNTQEKLHKKLRDKDLIISMGSAENLSNYKFEKKIMKTLNDLERIKNLREKIKSEFTFNKSVNVLKELKIK